MTQILLLKVFTYDLGYRYRNRSFIVVKPTVNNKEGIGMSQVKWTMRIFRAEERTETKAWKRVIDVS